MATQVEKPQERTFTDKEASDAFWEILALVAAGVRVHITRLGREVAVMELPMDRMDRLFRDLRDREAAESDVPARMTRPRFFQD